MIFIDASALISIIAGEDDADGLADVLEQERVRLISPMSAWETVAGLCRSYGLGPSHAQDQVRLFVESGSLSFISIGEKEYGLALQAYANYGKGRHRAALNMGDCFAYACAKANRAALLFKGTDFSQTDIRRAELHA